MRNREEWLAESMLELADTLVPGFEPLPYWLGVAGRFAELTGTSARLNASADQGTETVVVCTDERLETTALGEALMEEGPGADCELTGDPMVDIRLDGAAESWPRLVPAARALGFRVLHAFPLRLRETSLGSVTLLATAPDRLSEGNFRLARSLADVATISMLQRRAVVSLTETSGQLQHALGSRVVIEQAKGLISSKLEVSIEEAFELLRGYVRGRNLKLTDVATRLVDRSLAVANLLTLPEAGRKPPIGRG
ncbi:ANTAR domain-containing protein [Amycolatopsis saalfeldensis]|uniref:ANTAR domain-containing protein n=2 Tax=Amycolatopsis saalfeldensis TaxID=394193 RepID=A0A1H8YL92_9PSEU|nr:ANTAR domain-containing protein [Amycolatopsis saalfeldensis]